MDESMVEESTDWSQIEKRLRLYFEFQRKNRKKSFDVLWGDFEIQVTEKSHQPDIWIQFREDVNSADQILHVEMLSARGIREEEEGDSKAETSAEESYESDKEQEPFLKETWQDVKNIINNSQEFLKVLHDYLEKLAEKHPKITSLILTILISILSGLLTECLIRGIDAAKQQNEMVEIQEIVDMEEIEKMILIHGEEQCQIIYYTKDGKAFKGTIPEEKVFSLREDYLSE